MTDAAFAEAAPARGMPIHVAGSGKLAAELRSGLALQYPGPVTAWTGDPGTDDPAIVVHAGSGRELDAICAYCRRTSSVLLELATGSRLEGTRPEFPVVICPNTNILMLKFMGMLERAGGLFRNHRIRLMESHQATKSSVPGTAVAMAASLGIPAADIVSVRNAAEQVAALGVPPASLARHAFHRVQIEDEACQIVMETRVFGDAPYAGGVLQIIRAVQARPLEARLHSINEFIEREWI